MAGEGEIEGGNRDDEEIHYNPTNLSSDWSFNNPSDVANPSRNPMIKTSCSSASMVDSFGHTAPTLWDHQPTNSQNLGAFCDMNMQNNATTSLPSLGFWKGNLFVPPRNLDMCWPPTDFADKRGGMFLPPAASAVLPQTLSQFPAEPGFVERAARLSSFSGGSFEDVVNPFGNVHESSLSVYPDDGHQPKQGGSSFSGNNLPGETEFSGGGDENSNEGLASKKRRSDQDGDYNHIKRSPQTPSEVKKNNNEGQHKGESNPNSDANKSSGKHGKQVSPASDAIKEDYIHIRARRGQATNSHSLAERVRREKISERMKFLQDLVPGCSKVTGKAVMLDEIINYVQSLQRQVEFLSMKLATVNPRMDLNVEELLAKDIIESQLGRSGSLGANMAMPYTINQSQMANMRGGISGVGRSSDAVKRTVDYHLMSVGGGFKDPASHIPGAWDEELHNILQMGLNPGISISSQSLGSTPPGLLKTEP
ncbi:hypothetical protein SSX86_019755 [Deinandra increscens subsp. villosa]|uniref:BHLH domain-containing protein n=1 Tax=Deinandra increscens subsp. villosa TaxID=3103831 RepID=A0AAP0CXQ2_9ASTR